MKRRRKKWSPPRYKPSTKEIDRVCAEIRKTWSEGERQKRRGTIVKPWTAPVIRVDDLPEKLADMLDAINRSGEDRISDDE